MSLEYWTALNCTLAICIVFLFLENLVVIIIQGGKSVKAGTKPKEDQLPGRPLPNPTEKDLETETRWKRIVTNHNETIPFGSVVFLIAVNVVWEPSYRLALIILLSIYVFLRVIFTFLYVYAIQPYRTLSWFLSMSCIFAGGLVGVIDAFNIIQDIYG